MTRDDDQGDSASSDSLWSDIFYCVKSLENDMRLTSESLELVKAQHMNNVQEVFRRYRPELERLQLLARTSGPARGAIDDRYVAIISEVVDAKVASYLAAFRRENRIPTDEDIREIRLDLNETARSIWFGAGHAPMPEASIDEYPLIVPRAESKLKIAVRELRLEAKHAVSAVSQPSETVIATARAEPQVESADISVEDVDALELKPNIFGIGINLNHVIKRIAAWRKRRKK